ncbi:MAG: AbrB/MazE/SpoVT family DNA-binding domain-containing protein [Kiloniellales bacterium]
MKPLRFSPKEDAIRLVRCGSGLAVRLPAAVVEALGLKEGDEIEVREGDGRSLAVSRKADRDALLKRLRLSRGRLPPDFKLDRDDVGCR